MKVAYTRRLTDDDIAELECVSLTATTLQEFVPKAFEVRLTVIGNRWFPIAIHAATDGAHTDWRSDPSALSYEFVSVPDAVVDGVCGSCCTCGSADASDSGTPGTLTPVAPARCSSPARRAWLGPLRSHRHPAPSDNLAGHPRQ